MPALEIGDQSNFGVNQEKLRKFADPFLLPSSVNMPTSLDTAWDFCLFLYYMNPQYRRAHERLISHFITRIDFTDNQGDQDERDDLNDFLVDQLDIFGAQHAMGAEWSVYGNAFWRIHFPFERLLVDNRSGRPKFYFLDMFKDRAKYRFKELAYEVPDPTCLRPDGTAPRTVVLPFIDRVSTDLNQISLRRLDPRYVDLRHSWASGRTRVIYRFEEWFIKSIRDGHLWQVNETPIAMLRAIANDEDFLFHEDEIYHFKAPTVSGISNNAWGLPETIANYRVLHNVQVYRKIDEAVGLDYMLPFRIFTPKVVGESKGMLDTANLALWGSFMQEVIKSKRKDPFAMHAMPMGTELMQMGGDGKQLSPFENIQMADKQLMDALGIPIELWQGSLAVEQIPTTLRLFENTFHFIHRGFNGFLRWVVRRILDHSNREQIGVSQQLPSMADDLEERSIYLQLAAGGEISRQKAYRPFGIEDPVQEAKRRMQEDIEIQKEQSKIQQDFQREQQMGSADQILAAESQQGGGSMPGGAGPAPGGAQSDPLMIQQQGQEMATKLLGIQSDGERSKQLRQIEASNPNLYSVVKQKMEEMRRQGEAQGRASVGQQAQQAAQGGGQ